MQNLKLLFLLSLCSCASVPDVPICRSRTANTGFCTWTISNKDQVIDDIHMLNGKTWLDLKIESVMVPSDSWAEIKKYIIKQCKRDNNCSNDIGTWQGKLDEITP